MVGSPFWPTLRRQQWRDTAWATRAPLLPDNGQRGQQWRDHRQVINGILWKLRTEAPMTGRWWSPPAS